MSYEIVYDRQFIRTPDGIIPLVLSGSNNVCEMTLSGCERRARSWGSFFNGTCFTPDKLMAEVERYCGRKYQQHFKRGGKWVDDEGFRRFIRNGIKGALTLEEIRAIKPMASLHCGVDVYSGDFSHERELEDWCVDTTAKLVAWLKRAQERLDQKVAGEEVYINVSFYGDEPLCLSKYAKPVGRVSVKSGRNYISDIRRDGSICQSPIKADAMTFESVEDAMQRIPDWFRANNKLRFVKANVA